MAAAGPPGVNSVSGPTINPTFSPSRNSCRSEVSTTSNVSPTPLTITRVRSPRKKAVSTTPVRCPPSGAVIVRFSGRNSTSISPSPCLFQGNAPAAVFTTPFEMTPRTRFMVPMKSATNRFDGWK